MHFKQWTQSKYGVNMPAEEESSPVSARMETLKNLIEPIQGWIDSRAGAELYRLVRFEAPTSTIVEIGPWKGRSTAWLAFAAKHRGDGSRVYAIDTWQGSEEQAHKDLL